MANTKPNASQVTTSSGTVQSVLTQLTQKTNVADPGNSQATELTQLVTDLNKLLDNMRSSGLIS